MCKKLPKCAWKIDPCIQERIEYFQDVFRLKTILSCCGHNKYPETIIIRRPDNSVYEYYSLTILKDYNPKKKKQYNRYYASDKEGHYYIPEVMDTNPFKRTLLNNNPDPLQNPPNPVYWS